MAILTLQSLKKRLGVTDNDDDADLSDIVAASIALVEAYLGYDPETTAYSDRCAPTGERDLLLPSAPPNCPVTVTTVNVDTAHPPTWAAETLLVADEDYRQERAGGANLVRLNGHWPADWMRGPDRLAATLRSDVGSVRVVYVIDNTNVLAAAKRAALVEALAQYNLVNGGQGIGFVTGETVDGLSETINTSAFQAGRKPNSGNPFVSPAAATWLAPFRKLPIG